MKLVSLDPYFGWDIYYMKRLTYDGKLYARKKGVVLSVEHKKITEATTMLHEKIFNYEWIHSK